MLRFESGSQAINANARVEIFETQNNEVNRQIVAAKDGFAMASGKRPYVTLVTEMRFALVPRL